MKYIKDFLEQNKETCYKKFSASLIPNIDNVLGIRLPILRKFAKEIFLNHDWQSFLELGKVKFMEENLLQAMIISQIKDINIVLFYVEKFIPRINNWSVCDCLCSGLKIADKNQERVWKFISKYFNSNKEFEIRFVSVMLLSHFINETYIENTLKVLSKFKTDDYYAKMGIAWGYSVCFVKFFDKTLTHFKSTKISDWIFNKSIQKSCESFRLNVEQKVILKELKAE